MGEWLKGLLSLPVQLKLVHLWGSILSLFFTGRFQPADTNICQKMPIFCCNISTRQLNWLNKTVDEVVRHNFQGVKFQTKTWLEFQHCHKTNLLQKDWSKIFPFDWIEHFLRSGPIMNQVKKQPGDGVSKIYLLVSRVIEQNKMGQSFYLSRLWRIPVLFSLMPWVRVIGFGCLPVVAFRMWPVCKGMCFSILACNTQRNGLSSRISGRQFSGCRADVLLCFAVALLLLSSMCRFRHLELAVFIRLVGEPIGCSRNIFSQNFASV